MEYFGETGDAVEALKYSWLYWPKLVEFSGAVFLALDGNDETEIRQRLTASPGRRPRASPVSWQKAVDSFNIVEVAHLFRQWRGPVDLSPEVLRELASVLMRTWRYRLLERYPERVFDLQVIEPEEDWPELRIQVRQERPRLDVPAGWNERLGAVEVPPDQA